MLTVNTQIMAEASTYPIRFPLSPKGNIPVWLVCGPFEQPEFWNTVLDADSIGEATVEPYEGKAESGAMVEGGIVHWKVQSVDETGFLNFENSLGWINPGKIPQKIVQAKAGYACTWILSPQDRDILFLVGSNSIMKLYVNGKEVYAFKKQRNAVADDDTVRVHLIKGENQLLVKVGNSQYNYILPFWGGIDWGWGFYLRLLNTKFKPLADMQCRLPVTKKKTELSASTTFFFKKTELGLKQRIDLVINSRSKKITNANLEIYIKNKIYYFKFKNIRFGENRRCIYLPEIKKEIKAQLKLTINNQTIRQKVTLLPQKHYELHLMMLAHMDIGYTNPQPICYEHYVNTLDDVLAHCESDSEFSWTIETLLKLEEYENSRPKEKFQKLIHFIKNGRIAVSPMYANPFSGQISEGELIHTFSKARQYAREYGIEFPAAVYNDTPGLNWAFPAALKKVGAKFLVCGINEVYGGYKLQQELPKVFKWRGSDGSVIVTYITEGYGEGRTFGLEKNIAAMQNRIWQRLNTINAYGYPYDMVLLNAAFTDNAGIPEYQYQMAKKWNREFAYPHFVISNLDRFAKAFIRRYKQNIPELHGDWTSRWDIFSQGEPSRMIRQRFTQTNLNSAEKLASIAWLLNPDKGSLQNIVNSAYRSLLHFSGHGSGLEYGYGSPEENQLTLAYREGYVRDAFLKSQEAVLRSIDRIARPEFKMPNEGLMVFNTLSWKRDAPVEVNFPITNKNEYQVIDLVTKEKMPSFRQDHKLIFIARALPALGYKKFRLLPVKKVVVKQKSELQFKNNCIENRYYRLKFNKQNGNILSIWDKKSGRELINTKASLPFAYPLREVQNKPGYHPLALSKTSFEIIDQRPVLLKAVIKRENHIFKQTVFTLWQNMDRIDVNFTVNLEKLKKTKVLEQYGIAFPFAINDAKYAIEILGGFIDPEKDRFEVIDYDAFSIRHGVVQYNKKQSVKWASKDSRIIQLQGKHKTLIANLVNNFPESWNRNEANKGTLTFSYSFSCAQQSFCPSSARRFGQEFSTPPLVYRSLLRTIPTEKSFLQIDSKKIELLTMTRQDGKNNLVLFLKNSDSRHKASARVLSDFFNGAKIYLVNLLYHKIKQMAVKDNYFEVEFRPNEMKIILVELNKKMLLRR